MSAEDFNSTGAFNAFVDVDSRLHVDPHLLEESAAPELARSRQRFEEHFAKVLKLLKHSKNEGDRFWNAARDLIRAKEISETGLGYAKRDTGGSGIGLGLAGELTRVAKQIIDAGTSDVEIFELLGLFQEGVGADRISDMTVSVILQDLLEFSSRVARVLRVKTIAWTHQESTFQLPLDKRTGKSVLLVPRDILRRLPTSQSWYDIDRVAAHNTALRKRVNPIIGATWKKATSAKVGKEKFRSVVAGDKELVADLLARYRLKPRTAYDFEADPDAVFAWHSITQQLASESPLGLTATKPLDRDELMTLVMTICARFKKLVEDNRLSRLFYNDDRTPRKEKAAQLAFFGLADAYCEANDLDVSPEADGGVGPVDFKISRGYQFRVTVEMKLSSNQNLVHGFEVQLPAYQLAEKTQHGIYLVVKNGRHERRLKALEAARQKSLKSGQRIPEVIVVDGTLSDAASRRKMR